MSLQKPKITVILRFLLYCRIIICLLFLYCNYTDNTLYFYSVQHDENADYTVHSVENTQCFLYFCISFICIFPFVR